MGRISLAAAAPARLLCRYLGFELGGKCGLALAVTLISLWPSVAHQPHVVLAGEFLGYYSLVLVSGLWQRRNLRVVVAHTLAEFGVAELLDVFVIRALCLVLAMKAFGAQAGAWVGSLAADCVFYALASLVRHASVHLRN